MNGTGIVTFELNAGVDSVINDLIIQPLDGKTVSTGYSTGTDGQPFFCTARYDTSGALDTSFGNNGTVTTVIGKVSQANAIAIQSDNKIIVAGSSNDGSQTSFTLVRYNTDGSLDTSFGTNGIVTTIIGSNGSTINSIDIQSDQKIFAVGTAGIDYAAARYNTDGSLDATLGGTGVVSADFPNTQVVLYGVTLQSDDKSIGVGFYKGGSVNSQLFVAKANTDGSPDFSFGTFGSVLPTIGNTSVANSVTLDASNNIVVVGSTAAVANGASNFLIIRLTNAGAFDNTFGTNGIVTTMIGNNAQALDVAIQADGKIVVVGRTTSNTNFLNQFAIARYNSDGSLDNTFGTNGIITTAIGQNSLANAVVIQTNQKILVGGFSLNQTNSNLDFTLAQYNRSNNFSLNIIRPVNSSTVTTKIPSIFLTGSVTGAEVDVLVDGTTLVTGLLSNTGAFNAGTTLPLTNASHNVLANLIVTGATVISAENVFTVDAPDPEFGGVLRVDSIFGNDTNGTRNSFPFKTINGAFTQAQSGDLIWIYPGIYNETVTIPTGVSIRGTVYNACLISKQNVNTGTNLITIGENSCLEDLNLKLTSTGHYTLKGIVFPGKTTATAKIKNINLLIDNSSAWLTGTSNVYGIHSNGLGFATGAIPAVDNCNININSVGGGNKRGILVDTDNGLNIQLSNFYLTGSTGSIGLETNSTGAIANIYSSSLNGYLSDVSQTLGTINLGTQTVLENSNANSLGFGIKTFPSNLIFANAGTVTANSILFMTPGTGTATTTEIQIRMAKKCLVKSISVKAQTGPGGVLTDTFTLRKNGSDTALTTSLTSVATSNSNYNVSVHFDEGDLLSMKLVTSLGTTLANVTVIVDVY